MTISRRLVSLMLAGLAGSFAGTSAAAAASTPQPAKAPGRVAFSVDGGVVSNDDDGGGASAGVALPGGGAALVGNGGAAGDFHTYVAEVGSNGLPNPSFGAGGVVTLPGMSASQILLQPDGSLVVAGSGVAATKFQGAPIVLVRLHADGSIDPSFGTAGTLTLPIQSSCGDCAAVATLPSGDLVVTGVTGQLMPAVDQNPPEIADTQWVVARLTPTGALDPGFGEGGVVTLIATGASGTGVADLANGDVVALGNVSSGGTTLAVLTRLLPSGAEDPTFNGGSLVAVPGGASTDMIAEADGTVVVDASAAVVRYTAAGLQDPTFGTGGLVPLTGFVAAAVLPPPDPAEQTVPTRLLPAPGDGAVVYNVGDGGIVLAERLDANGSLDTTTAGSTAKRIGLGFGGGGGGVIVSVRPRPLPPLAQDSADIRGSIVERANGSFLAVNGVSVVNGTGEGEGQSIFDFALAGLTPSFARDPTVGGPATALYAKLRVIKQHASTDHTRHGILVELTLSQPGLERVLIKAHGRVVAQNVLPVLHAGESTLPVELTAYGNQLLRSGHGIEVTAVLTGRDLLTNTAASTASGTLR